MEWNAFWEAVSGWDDQWHLITVAVIILGAMIIRGVLILVIDRVVRRIVNGAKKRQGADDTQGLLTSPLAAMRIVQRTKTLGAVLSNILTALIVTVTVLLLFVEVVPQATSAFALITAALGAGLGFGAQNIVKDVLNGLFMVSEDQLGIGDVVDVGFATGVVEGVGIRITQIRDVNGTLWYVRNGEILRTGNMSQGWARVIVDLAVPYDVDVDAIQARILGVAVDLSEDEKWRPRILERPEVWGIESVSAEAIVLRLVVKTAAQSKDDVARELRARLKRALDEDGVKLPSLNSIVLSGAEGANSVRGARPPRTRAIPTKKDA